MSNFPEDMVSFLQATTALVDVLGTTLSIHYNRVPDSSQRAYVYMRTASDTVARCLDRTATLHEAFIDVEAIADTESGAQSVADQLHARLDGYKGTVGNSSAQGMFLTDKDDNYEPRGLNDDDGRHVIAYDLHVWYST